MNNEVKKIFYEIYKDLPRKGPGSYNSTLKTYNYIKGYLHNPTILDIGCGNGRQSFDLLEISEGKITAVDNYPPYIKEINDTVTSAGLQDRLKAEAADMQKLQYADNSFDVVWSEGAIYNIGFEKGLREFKRLLKQGGFLCASEISWLSNNPADELYKFWTGNYPGINTIDNNLAAVGSAGYISISHFVLPESAWRDDFYDPLTTSIQKLKRKYGNNIEALKLLDAEQYEIELYKKYSNEYGYAFYIMRLAG